MSSADQSSPDASTGSTGDSAVHGDTSHSDIHGVDAPGFAGAAGLDAADLPDPGQRGPGAGAVPEELAEHVDAREVEIKDLADVPAQEIISRSIVVLLSASAEKLGLSEEDPSQSPHLDLDEARRLITALAGLVAGSAEYLGPQAGVVKDALQGLQRAFRDASAFPDAPGQGPGEKFTGPLY